MKVKIEVELDTVQDRDELEDLLKIITDLKEQIEQIRYDDYDDD